MAKRKEPEVNYREELGTANSFATSPSSLHTVNALRCARQAVVESFFHFNSTPTYSLPAAENFLTEMEDYTALVRKLTA